MLEGCPGCFSELCFLADVVLFCCFDCLDVVAVVFEELLVFCVDWKNLFWVDFFYHFNELVFA